MYTFGVELSGFDGARTLPVDVPNLITWLEALAQTNQRILRANPRLPRLYEAGVVYDHDGLTDQPFRDILRTLERGRGDCKAFAAWRVAELRERDGAADARFALAWLAGKRKQNFHVAVRHPRGAAEQVAVRTPRGVISTTVRHPAGYVEDPSRRLGMVG